MPGGDRTGPRGEGPRTGWGLGFCEGYDQPGYATSRPYGWTGRGYRRGGRGRGWRNRAFDAGWPVWDRGPDTQTPSDQNQILNSLKDQAKELQETLKQIQSRLDKLEA